MRRGFRRRRRRGGRWNECRRRDLDSSLSDAARSRTLVSSRRCGRKKFRTGHDSGAASDAVVAAASIVLVLVGGDLEFYGTALESGLEGVVPAGRR